MLKATIEGIRLREAPSVDAEVLGVLPVSSRSFVVSGPVLAGGFEWYLLSGPGLPPSSGCATFPGPEFSCPVWFGWAATGNAETGDPWFIDDPTDCPDPATDGAAVMLLPDIEALHCYGGQQLVLTGWLPEAGLHEPFQCPTGVPSLTWLYCPDAYAATIFAVDDQAVSIEVFIDPASGEEFTGVDYWPIVMGHHDDPAAQGCDDAISPGHPIYPQLAVLECRARFVADQLGAVAP